MTSTVRLSPPGGVVNEAVPALSLRGQWHCAPPSGPASPLSFLPLRTPPPPPRLLPSAQEGRRASGCRAVTEECHPPTQCHTRAPGPLSADIGALGQGDAEGLWKLFWVCLSDCGCCCRTRPALGQSGVSQVACVTSTCPQHLQYLIICPALLRPVPTRGPAVRLSHGCHHSSGPRCDLAGRPGSVPCRAAVSLGGVVPEPSVERFLHTHSACCLHGPGVGAPVCARGTVLSGPSDWCASTPPLPARTCSSALLSWAGLGQRHPRTPLHTC